MVYSTLRFYKLPGETQKKNGKTQLYYVSPD